MASMNGSNHWGVDVRRAAEDETTARRAGGAVVVHVDSDAALPAVLWAAEQCRRTGATLQLVTCTGGGKRQRDAAANLLRDIAATAGRVVPGVRITAGSLPGAAVPTLVELSTDAAMIVVPDAGAERERSEVGTISWALASRGHCPLIVWRPTVDPGSPGPVVVGVDGSPISVRALDFAVEQASWLQVPLVVVMAWSDVYFDTERQILDVVTDWTTVAEDYRRLLAEQLAGVKERFPDVSVKRLLTQDRPVRALLKAAESAQLLVVGSHGQGGFPGMLLGSVSRALIDYSPCPLAVVRPAAPR